MILSTARVHFLEQRLGEFMGDKPVSAKGSTSPQSWRNTLSKRAVSSPYVIRGWPIYLSKTFLCRWYRLLCETREAFKRSQRPCPWFAVLDKWFCIGRFSCKLAGRIKVASQEEVHGIAAQRSNWLQFLFCVSRMLLTPLQLQEEEDCSFVQMDNGNGKRRPVGTRGLKCAIMSQPDQWFRYPTVWELNQSYCSCDRLV